MRHLVKPVRIVGPLLGIVLLFGTAALSQDNPLPSWNDGPTKQAILDFVEATTGDVSGDDYVPPAERIAVFDQDGTLWTEHPIYGQVAYILDRVPAVVEAKPELRDAEPFKTVLTGDPAAIAKLPKEDLVKLFAATLTGMTAEEFQTDVREWLKTARHPRFDKPYTELTFLPMQEVLKYLRANGYKTYIVTGGGQDFVRVYAEEVYGIPPEQVVGSIGAVEYGHDANGKPIFTKLPKLILNDDKNGKPEGIHMVIGRRPHIAFGNTAGDQAMLDYTTFGAAPRARLGLLVLHDDAKREYAYGPADGLPDSKIGTFSRELYDTAMKRKWTVISMKKDWKRVYAFEE